MAWKRIGALSIVIFLVSREKFMESEARRAVYDILVMAEAHIYFISDSFLENTTNDRLSPLLAQVKIFQRKIFFKTARIYAASLPDFPGDDDSILITSDSDLLPFSLHNHIPSRGKLIRAYCAMNDTICRSARVYSFQRIQRRARRSWIWYSLQA